MLIKMINNSKLLNEIRIVNDFNRSNLILSIELLQTRKGDGYFKVYHKTTTKGSKKARILFQQPVIITHFKGADYLKLTPEQLSRVVELLNMPAKIKNEDSELKNAVLKVYGTLDNFLNWHYLICKFNDGMGMGTITYEDTLRNNSKITSNKKLIPVTTKIQDYEHAVFRDEANV